MCSLCPSHFNGCRKEQTYLLGLESTISWGLLGLCRNSMFPAWWVRRSKLIGLGCFVFIDKRRTLVAISGHGFWLVHCLVSDVWNTMKPSEL